MWGMTREQASRWHAERITALRGAVASGPRADRPVAEVELKRRTWGERVAGRLLEVTSEPRLFGEAYCNRCRACTWLVARECEGLTFTHCMHCGTPTSARGDGNRHPDRRVREGLLSPSEAQADNEAKAAERADYDRRRFAGQLTHEELRARRRLLEASQRKRNRDLDRVGRGLWPAPADPSFGYTAAERAHYGRELPFHAGRA